MFQYVYYFIFFIKILIYPLIISAGGQYVPHELSYAFDAESA